jgi:hypothetical protein
MQVCTNTADNFLPELRSLKLFTGAGSWTQNVNAAMPMNVQRLLPVRQ